MSKLDETKNILDLFMHCTGKTEVPPQWYKWACLSIVASSVGNRVFYQKFPWEHINPNMFVFLIGPSGLGKGQAINFAMQLRHNKQNLWYGDATNKGLKDHFSSMDGMQIPDHITPPWVTYVVQTELADSVGSGNLADAFIKSMTNWYNPTKTNFRERTRLHGEKEHPPPTLNWLAGTTVEWLQSCVTRDAMLSGFFGRVVGVYGDYDWSKRIYDPMAYQPKDYDEIIDYLCERIDNLTDIPPNTPMKMTRDARIIDEQWYNHRTPPRHEARPFFRREPDLAIKLAMILSLCRSQSLIIDEEDISEAHKLVMLARNDMLRIVAEATNSKSQLAMDAVLDLLKRKHPHFVKRSAIHRLVSRWGYDSSGMELVLRDLDERELIETRSRGGRKEYAYKPQNMINLRVVGDNNDAN